MYSIGKYDTLTADVVILWILVFYLNLPATIYFSESSNSCCILLSRFYKGNPWESLGGGCVCHLFQNWKLVLYLFDFKSLKSICFLTLISSVQFSRSVVSNSLRPHGSQHARPPCPSPSMLLCVSTVCSFLLLSSIPLYEFLVCLSTHLSVGI